MNNSKKDKNFSLQKKVAGNNKSEANQSSNEASSSISQLQKYIQEGTSEQEIIRMKYCFDAFDVDNNGYLDISELKEAINELGMTEQSELLLKRVQECDINGDKQLSFEEFLNWMGIYDKDKKVNDANIDDLFQMVSKDGLSIGLEDILKLNQELNEKYTMHELNDMLLFANNETNLPVLNFQQFQQVLTTNYDL